MIDLAIVIITKNEAHRLPPCLAALKNCGDIFVVDSNSTDGTADLARAAGAQVINFTWNHQYPKKKQWVMNTLPAHYTWILFVDADERVTPELAQEILNFRRAPPDGYHAYWIDADPVWLGQRLRHGQRNHKICLQHRTHTSYPVVDDLDAVPFEMEGHYQPLVTGKTGHFQHRMLHICDPVDSWMLRHITYAKANAALAASANSVAETGWRKYAKRWLAHNPNACVIIFIYGYILRLGFLDGRAGFHYAIARAWYYWLSSVLRQTASADTAAAHAA